MKARISTFQSSKKIQKLPNTHLKISNSLPKPYEDVEYEAENQKDLQLEIKPEEQSVELSEIQREIRAMKMKSLRNNKKKREKRAFKYSQQIRNQQKDARAFQIFQNEVVDDYNAIKELVVENPDLDGDSLFLDKKVDIQTVTYGSKKGKELLLTSLAKKQFLKKKLYGKGGALAPKEPNKGYLRPKNLGSNLKYKHFIVNTEESTDTKLSTDKIMTQKSSDPKNPELPPFEEEESADSLAKKIRAKNNFLKKFKFRRTASGNNFRMKVDIRDRLESSQEGSELSSSLEEALSQYERNQASSSTISGSNMVKKFAFLSNSLASSFNSKKEIPQFINQQKTFKVQNADDAQIKDLPKKFFKIKKSGVSSPRVIGGKDASNIILSKENQIDIILEEKKQSQHSVKKFVYKKMRAKRKPKNNFQIGTTPVSRFNSDLNNLDSQANSTKHPLRAFRSTNHSPRTQGFNKSIKLFDRTTAATSNRFISAKSTPKNRSNIVLGVKRNTMAGVKSGFHTRNNSPLNDQEYPQRQGSKQQVAKRKSSSSIQRSIESPPLSKNNYIKGGKSKKASKRPKNILIPQLKSHSELIFAPQNPRFKKKKLISPTLKRHNKNYKSGHYQIAPLSTKNFEMAKQCKSKKRGSHSQKANSQENNSKYIKLLLNRYGKRCNISLQVKQNFNPKNFFKKKRFQHSESTHLLRHGQRHTRFESTPVSPKRHVKEMKHRFKTATIKKKMEKISEHLMPSKETFDVFALGHGKRVEFGHLHSQHQSIVNPDFKNSGFRKGNKKHAMSSVDLWGTKHFIHVMEQGEFMSRKKKVEDYKLFEKKLRLSSKFKETLYQ